MDAGLRRAMLLLPRMDFADPPRVRAQTARNRLLAQRAGLWRGTHENVAFEDRVVEHRDQRVRVRLYFPRGRTLPAPAIVYFHGGAFVIGDLEFEHPRCLEMADQTQCIIVAADYRLAPEHPFPAGIDDCRTAYEWTISSASELGIDATRIAVAGASAGGALAAAMALMARDHGLQQPAFQLLIYPVIDDRMTTPSMQSYVDLRGWDRRNSEHMWRHYVGQVPFVDDLSHYAAPGRAADLRGLPPAYVMTVELDALRDEGIQYAQRLMAAGVSTELHHYAGGFHGFDTVTDVALARAARAEHYDRLRTALSGS